MEVWRPKKNVAICGFAVNSMDPQRFFGFAALVLVIIGNATGNVLLKLGANPDVNRPLFGVFAWQTITGIACFGLGILAYAWALKHLDLHVAQIVVSLQYITVIMLAAWLLGEQISFSQWLGMAMIAVGIFVCMR